MCDRSDVIRDPHFLGFFLVFIDLMLHDLRATFRHFKERLLFELGWLAK
jgi:hypothetical protein